MDYDILFAKSHLLSNSIWLILSFSPSSIKLFDLFYYSIFISYLNAVFYELMTIHFLSYFFFLSDYILFMQLPSAILK
jgi:hypothetical protein